MRSSLDSRRTLAFRSYSFDVGAQELFTDDISGRRQCAYTVHKHQSSDGARITRAGGMSAADEVGSFQINALSFKIDIELHGQHSQLKRGGKWRNKHVFEWPPIGTLHWKERERGKELQLVDEDGRTLVRCVSDKAFFFEQAGRIEILVPGDDSFVDMCVVTSLAKWRNQEILMQAAASASASA
jgi:hypothetical protein